MNTEPKPATGEWTVEQVKGTLDAHGYAGLVRAHNAALAAEKAREEHDWGHVKREYLRLQKENEKLTKQLAAEMEEHAKALLAKQTRIEIFQEQLAAAQAAIRDIQGEVIALVDAKKLPNSVLHKESPKRIKEKVNAFFRGDTTALASAIASAQKPLVDALGEIAATNGLEAAGIAERALAKVGK